MIAELLSLVQSVVAKPASLITINKIV